MTTQHAASRPTGVVRRMRHWSLDAVPAGIWSRSLLLFSGLCLVNFLIVVALRKHLFEIHWRVADEPVTAFNYVVFYAFVLLAGWNLWVFGERCQASGTRTVRQANFCVLGLAAFFILVTFHEGDKNYLYPVLHGILPVQKLGWYFSLDFFFRVPYLSAWLLGYALAYYFLARTKREYLALQLTAACATLYFALCLRDLVHYPETLLAADCVGACCLISGWQSKKPLGWSGWIFPWAVAGFFLILFGIQSSQISRPDAEFIILAVSTAVLFGILTVVARKRGFYLAWSWVCPFCATAVLLLIQANYTLAENYQNLFDVALMMPGYFLGALIVSAAMTLVYFFYFRRFPEASRLWFDGLAFLILVLSIVDLRIAQIMGIRLDWQILIFGDSPRMMWRMARPYLPALAGVIVLAVIGYVVILRLLKTRMETRGSVGATLINRNWLFLLLAILMLGTSQYLRIKPDKARGQAVTTLIETSPWWKKIYAQQTMSDEAFLKLSKDFGVTTLSQKENASGTPRDLNVIFILQESTYNKYLSLFGSDESTQPLLSQYKDRMEIYPNFFANFAASIWARFANFTGLYPSEDFNSFTAKHVDVESLFDVLSTNGYEASLFYSSYLDYTGFRDFLRDRGLKKIYDADTMPGERKTELVSWGLHEEDTLSAIQAQIRQYSTNHQKFFLTYIPAAPHYPYDKIPERFRKNKTQKFQDFKPRYLNELLYMDWIMASILDELKTSGLLDKTLVVITADHGEMLGGDDEAIGHGWAVRPELENVPLIIMDPERRGFRTNYTIGSQVDLLPTLLDILRLPLPKQQFTQGASLCSPYLQTNRFIFLNSEDEYAVLRNGQFFLGNRSKGAGDFANSLVLSNTGSRTFFLTNNTPVQPPTFDVFEFDRFQGIFLENYSHYCDVWFRTPRNY